MDKEAFQADLRIELKKMPPDLVPILKELAVKFGPSLEPLIMTMVQNLQRHVMAIMLELQMGTITKGEIETMVMEVFKGEIS
jgi:hypothetical protein